MLPRTKTLLAACIAVMGLGGCMTQQQGTAFQQAMLNGLAQGMLSGAGANIGQAIATGNKRLVKVAAAQLAAGAVTQAGATAINGGRPPSTAGATPAAFGGAPAAAGGAPAAGGAAIAPGGASGQDMSNYPNTPQCAAMKQFMNAGFRTHLAMGGDAAYTRLMQLEHACLASAPDHPMSRRRACGGGNYYHYLGYPTRAYCGWRNAVAAFRASF